MTAGCPQDESPAGGPRSPEVRPPAHPGPRDAAAGDEPGPRTLSGDEPGPRTLASLLGDPRAVAHLALPARVGVREPWPDWLDPRVRDAYVEQGISSPWRHQVVAAQLAWTGTHVMIATGTASGKTLAFGMPALTAALLPRDPTSGRRAPGVLYLAPTKALAHDQLAGLHALGLADLRAAALDGDSPEEERAWTRAHARWVVTNPDMLHRAVLPGHERWRGLLASLRFVVIDEAHTYRGVFGSHVALVLRRLRRVCARYGASPTVILASATAADPASSGARLIGEPVSVVDQDDSTRGSLDLVVWNPSAVAPQEAADADLGGADLQAADADLEGADLVSGPGPRPSALHDSIELTCRLVDSATTTLTFARSRRGVEVIAAAVRERAARGAQFRAYRGGYLPEERRALEAQLRSGELIGMAATSALELGIDITGLDAVVLSGWPGTHASFRQQVGRAGRRGASALAVLVVREDPLDQYLSRHPDLLTDATVEATVLDPGNPYVLAGHLCAAAAEVPLTDDALEAEFGPGSQQICAALADRGLLRRRRGGWYWTDHSRPADLVDLRGTAGGPVRVVEHDTGRVLGTVDASAAAATVHEDAIYVHQGATFQVISLDLESRLATASPVVTDVSTHARTQSHVELVSPYQSQRWGPAEIVHGEVVLSSQVTSYLVRRWPGGHVVGERLLDLPETRLSTMATWWSIPSGELRAAGIDDAAAPGALHALEHASIGILPLLATCDRWDLGGVSTALHPQTGTALISVHDGHPGGAGFAARGFEQALPWLRATREAIATCGCEDGCPACVQSPKCGNGNNPLDKAGALRLADRLLATGPDPTPASSPVMDGPPQ